MRESQRAARVQVVELQVVFVGEVAQRARRDDVRGVYLDVDGLAGEVEHVVAIRVRRQDGLYQPEKRPLRAFPVRDRETDAEDPHEAVCVVLSLRRPALSRPRHLVRYPPGRSVVRRTRWTRR